MAGGTQTNATRTARSLVAETKLAVVGDCLLPITPSAPHSPSRHNRRGDTLLLSGKAGPGLNAFNAALAVTPGNAYVLYNRGVALRGIDRTDEAKADFINAASPNSKQPGARKLAAQTRAAMK